MFVLLFAYIRHVLNVIENPQITLTEIVVTLRLHEKRIKPRFFLKKIFVVYGPQQIDAPVYLCKKLIDNLLQQKLRNC